MKRYDIFVRLEAADLLKSLPTRQRDPIRKFIDSLAENPYLPGETQERDQVGNELQVKAFGNLAVIFFADHAVREVRVVSLVELG